MEIKIKTNSKETIKELLDVQKEMHKTKSSLTGQPRRIDKKLVDPKCLREAFLNAVAHNNWINNIPPAVYVFSDRIEIQSNGGLPKGLSKEEFFKGTSAPRCPELMRILRDLEYVEQTGIGITKIVEVYGKEAFDISDNFITVTLPFDEEVVQIENGNPGLKFLAELTHREYTVFDFVQKNGFIKRKQVEENLNISKSTARRLLVDMVKKEVLRPDNTNRETRYFLNINE